MSAFRLTIGTEFVGASFVSSRGDKPPTWLFAQAAKFIAEETSNRCMLDSVFRVYGSLDCLGEGAEALAMFFRAHGYDVEIAVAADVTLCHAICGRRYRASSWMQRSARRQPDGVDGRSSFIETRECDCGSTITYASLRVELS